MTRSTDACRGSIRAAHAATTACGSVFQSARRSVRLLSGLGLVVTVGAMTASKL
jgi:hypothetical protein